MNGYALPTLDEPACTSPMWRLTGLFQFDGLKRVPAESVSMGDIVALCGHGGYFHRRYRLRPDARWSRLPFVKISEPTVTHDLLR